MTNERFNDVVRIINEHYNYLNPFSCESLIDKERTITEYPVILHLAWVPCQLMHDLEEMGFSSTAFPDESFTLALWIGDIMIHYNSTPKD